MMSLLLACRCSAISNNSFNFNGNLAADICQQTVFPGSLFCSYFSLFLIYILIISFL